jgi:multimeric flavodoxin WrbA
MFISSFWQWRAFIGNRPAEDPTMKILAVNGSPRQGKGNTDRVLKPFLAGAEQAGADIDLVYLQAKNIKPCRGCNACWLKTPGRCIQKDDMTELVELMRRCEVLVLASPIYVGGLTGQMKTFLDRLTPVSRPFIELVNGFSTHQKTEGSVFKGLVLVSNNGFHELYHFDDLVAHCRSIARMMQAEFLGSLLRPHGVMLEMAEQAMPDRVAAVYEAARRAGRELVEEGRVSAEMEAEVSRELIPREAFIKAMNGFFHKAWDSARDPGPQGTAG